MFIWRHSLAVGLALAALLSVALLSGCQAAGAKYPAKPIAITVPNAAGTVLDLYSRETARHAEKLLKVAMPVENRAGGNGATAYAYIKGQPADGYNVVVTSRSHIYNFARPDTPMAVDELEWVIRGSTDPVAFFVRADGPVKTLEDFVKAAKASPNPPKIGGSGGGAVVDHVVQRFADAAGIKTAWVAFDGSPQAITAALGGHIDGVSMTTSAGLAMVRDKKLLMLAVASEKRVEFISDVPTFKEKGYDVLDSIWRGMAVKKGTPPEVVKTLHDTFKQVSELAEWKEYLKKVEATDAYLNTADFNKVAAKETEEARAYLKSLGTIK